MLQTCFLYKKTFFYVCIFLVPFTENKLLNTASEIHENLPSESVEIPHLKPHTSDSCVQNLIYYQQPESFAQGDNPNSVVKNELKNLKIAAKSLRKR